MMVHCQTIVAHFFINKIIAIEIEVICQILNTKDDMYINEKEKADVKLQDNNKAGPYFKKGFL
jgi:hypothetical protein